MPGGTITLAEWNKILADHGQPVTRKVGTDKITNPRSKRVTDDPYPTVDYTFADGTSLSMKGIPSADSGPDSVSWSVVNQKGILDAKAAGTGPPTTRPITPNTQMWNPTTQQFEDVPGGDAPTVPGSGTPATPDYSGTSQGQSDVSGPSMVGGTPDVTTSVYNAQTSRQNADRQQKIDDENRKRQAEQDARQKAQDWLNEQHQKTSDDLADRRITIEAARQKADADHQKAQEMFDRQKELLSQSWVTADQYQNLQGAEANLAKVGGVPFTPNATPAPLGYDPRQIAAQLAQQALAGSGGQQPQVPFQAPDAQQPVIAGS